tara:strand:+ start:4573 stop:6138 length:1566 start_codon:yes stop_codon:yes gene_type:complete
MAVLDPQEYMQAVRDANELRNIQRTNQDRQNFQQFTPNIATDSIGLKLPDQPDTLNIKQQAEEDRIAKEQEDYNAMISKRGGIDPTLNPGASDIVKDQAEIQKAFEGTAYRTFTLREVLKSGEGLASFVKLPSGLYKRKRPRIFGNAEDNKRYYDAIEKNRIPAAKVAAATRPEGTGGGLENVGVFTGSRADATQVFRDELALIEEMPNSPEKIARLEDLKTRIKDSGVVKLSEDEAKRKGITQVRSNILTDIERIKKDSEPEKITLSFQNVELAEANDAVRLAIQKRNEIARLANIARVKGNEEEFNNYRNQLSGLDIGIARAQGMQGLNDITQGDTRRLTAALRFATGLNIQITPRDDGSFTVVGLSDQPEIKSVSELISQSRQIFDREYKAKLENLQIELFKENYKFELETKRDLYKTDAEFRKDIALKQKDMEIAAAKKGWTFTKDVDDGQGGFMTIAEKDGLLFRVRSSIQEDQKGKEILYFNLEPIGGFGSALYSTQEYMNQIDNSSKPNVGVQQ